MSQLEHIYLRYAYSRYLMVKDGITIRDFLWNGETGLSVESYSEEDINIKTEEVFRHVYWAYPRLPSPIYAQ